MKKDNWTIAQEFDFEKAEKALDDHGNLISILSVLPTEKLFSHFACFGRNNVSVQFVT